MPEFTCKNPECGREFYSKHSTAKYCTSRCAGKVSGPKNLNFVKQSGPDWSDSDLKDIIISLAKAKGRTPSCNDIRNDRSLPHLATFCGRFGSWNKAVEAAGLTPRPKGFCVVYTNRRKNNVEDDPDPNAVIRPGTRFKVLHRDGFRCVYCGRSPRADGVTLQVDHVIPVSKGGRTQMSNLVAACQECNIGKSNVVEVASQCSNAEVD